MCKEVKSLMLDIIKTLLEHQVLAVLIIPEDIKLLKSSPDSCVKFYTMFLPFLLIKIDVFS
ncbi:hypothetical protein B6178_12020 [Staphylococcus aureus]|nr:hypothetical protein B6178_12020 [Staphylococcus aureus]